VEVWTVGLEGGVDELGGSARNGAFFDEDGGGFGVDGDFVDYGFEGCHVCCAAAAHAAGFGGCVDGDEDDVGFADAFRDFG